MSRACAARCTLGELEAALERLLQQRERARVADLDPDAKHLLRYLRDSIADTQAQIMQIEVPLSPLRIINESDLNDISSLFVTLRKIPISSTFRGLSNSNSNLQVLFDVNI